MISDALDAEEGVGYGPQVTSFDLRSLLLYIEQLEVAVAEAPPTEEELGRLREQIAVTNQVLNDKRLDAGLRRDEDVLLDYRVAVLAWLYRLERERGGQWATWQHCIRYIVQQIAAHAPERIEQLGRLDAEKEVVLASGLVGDPPAAKPLAGAIGPTGATGFTGPPSSSRFEAILFERLPTLAGADLDAVGRILRVARVEGEPDAGLRARVEARIRNRQ